MTAKKPPDQVRRRNTKLVSVLPLEGRKGPAPPWPLASPATTAEKRRWKVEWSKPAAVMWEQWHCEHLVARYVRLAVRAEEPGAGARLMPEIRHLENDLGLNPQAVFKLQWTLAAELMPADRVADLEAYRRAVGAEDKA